MKNQILRFGDKVVVKFNSIEPSAKSIRRAEKEAGCVLNFCEHSDSGLIVWNGPSNVRVAGFIRLPRKSLRRLGYSEISWIWKDVAGHTPKQLIARKIQSAYSKLRYSKKFSSRIYEGLVRPKASYGFTVCDFKTPTLP